MTIGWFAFTLTACIVLCSGFFIATAILRASWAQRGKDDLTIEDWRVIEESALCLIEDLKAEVDRGIAELDKRSDALRGLLAEADRVLGALKEINTVGAITGDTCSMISDDAALNTLPADKTRVLKLASGGLDCARIAKITGMDCAEIKLLLNVGKLPV